MRTFFRLGLAGLLAFLLMMMFLACGPGGGVGGPPRGDATVDGSGDASTDRPMDGQDSGDGESGITGDPMEASAGDEVDEDAGEGGDEAGEDGGADGAELADGSEDGGSDGGSDDGSMDAPETGACTVTLSGSLGGTYGCLAGIGSGGPIGGATLTVAVPGLMGFSFLAQLSSSVMLQTGTYDSSNAVKASATATNTNGGVWAMGYNLGVPQGSFSVDVQSAGMEVSSSMGNSFLNAFGTATADLPIVPGDTQGSGTVTMTIQWATFAYPSDGGMPDASTDAQDDGPTDAPDDADESGSMGGGPCVMTLTGGITSGGTCMQSAIYTHVADAGLSLSTVTLSLMPDDASTTGTVSVSTAGPLMYVTYTSGPPATVGLNGASSTIVIPLPDGGQEGWAESWVDGGGPGSFSLNFTTLGVQQAIPTGVLYIGSHGTYTATLPALKTGMVDAGDGGDTGAPPPVLMTVKF